MRKILFLTGTRADFGKLKPLIQSVQNNCELHIIATGMHLMAQYGMTCLELEKAGLKYFPLMNQDGGTPMENVLANTVQGLSLYIKEHPIDLIVVHGDRVEALAGAIVGAFENILVAHIEGGEVSGTIDESIRHAITKLAHIHFVSNDEAAARLRQMGETNIFIIGSPDIDIMLSDSLTSIEEVKEHYRIPFDEYAICVYHPVTTEPIDLAIFDALKESKKNYVVIYPNNDPGSEQIIGRINALVGNFHIIPSMRFEYFLSLLKHAQFIIGNSSAGIREAPVYGIPTIDIGSRQDGRYSGPSVVNCRAIDEIRAAIANPPKAAPSFHFGHGDSAKRFAETLPRIWDISPQKRFVDIGKTA